MVESLTHKGRAITGVISMAMVEEIIKSEKSDTLATGEITKGNAGAVAENDTEIPEENAGTDITTTIEGRLLMNCRVCLRPQSPRVNFLFPKLAIST